MSTQGFFLKPTGVISYFGPRSSNGTVIGYDSAENLCLISRIQVARPDFKSEDEQIIGMEETAMKLTACLFMIAALSLNIVTMSGFAQDAKQKATSATEAARLARLETSLENLRQELKIPAMSVAIVKD